MDRELALHDLWEEGLQHLSFHCIPDFKIKSGQMLLVCTQYPKAPIKSINSQVTQQLSSPANYTVQITLSCQPLTHVRTHTHQNTYYIWQVLPLITSCARGVSASKHLWPVVNNPHPNAELWLFFHSL